MPWTTYKSTDASAPVLSGTTGSLITVLDAILVDGYGAKSAAGWTKEYSGTSKAAYRNGAASIARTYLRVNDAGPGAGSFREARVVLYATMSDVDTGTLPVPTVAQMANGLFVRKSTTLDSTARRWLAIADDRTLILFIETGDSISGISYWTGNYFGDIFSYLTADAMGAFISARSAENSGAIAGELLLNFCSNLSSLSTTCGYLSGTHAGVYAPLQLFALGSPFINAGGPGYLAAVVQYPNPADGAVWITTKAPLVAATGPVIRGHLRGIGVFCHSVAAVSSLDTVTGSGDLAGRTFVLLHASSVNGAAGVAAIETTSSLPYSS